jgi:putative ABC transport system permease protein
MDLAPYVAQPLRALRRRPGFTTVVILTLTLGIGVTTAVFSIFNGVLLTPLAFPKPQQLVAVYDTQPSCTTCPASYPKYRDWVDRNRVFSAIGGATGASYVLTSPGADPVRLIASRTTASYFDVFRVPAIAGRWYTEAEDQPNGPKVAVLNHAFWMRQFQGSSKAIGSKLVLDGVPYEVVGVAPPDFGDRRTDLFVPLQVKLDPATRGSHFLPVYARLRDGVTVETARRQMQQLGDALAKEFGTSHGIDVQSYTEMLVGDIRRPLEVLLAAVFLLLLIGASNVANLMLAAGLARRRDLAVRMSLGATMPQLAQMMAAEGIWLAMAGGVLGVVLSSWIVAVFVAMAGTQLPRASAVHLDLRVLAFSAATSLLVGVVCSLFPLVLLHRSELATGVRDGDVRSGGAGQAGNRARRALVVAEFALAFGLLVCSALLIKSLLLLRARDPGVRTDHIVSFRVELNPQRYSKDSQVRTFYHTLYQRLIQINGVRTAGLTSHLPMVDYGFNGDFQIDGDAPWPPNQAPLVEYRWIYGDYLKTLGVPLLQGRLLDEHDGDGSLAVLINKAMAEKFWPGKDPLGRRFGQGTDKAKWYEVAGVIGNVRSFGMTRSFPFEFYRTIDQSSYDPMTVVLSTSAEDPLTLVPLARQLVTSLDSTIPITRVRTMEAAVSESLDRPRLMSALMGLFGALAGLLAMVGVYSVMADNVNRQRREFGIRLALGAAPASIRRLVLSRGLVLAFVGVAIGALMAMGLTHLLESILYGVKPADSSVFGLTAVAVILVTLLACALPARSAARSNPVDILRSE